MGRETQGSPAAEQKLERYGVWVKVEPRTVVETSGGESSFELTDLETAGASASSLGTPLESTLTVEEEKLLDELDTELGPSAKEPSIPEEEPLLAEEEELPDISEIAEPAPSPQESAPEEELPELEVEEEPATPRRAAAVEPNEVEVTLSDTGADKGRFEDLDALESELASVSAPAAKAQAASPEILARIEEELRSIRADLTQLRAELSGIRAAEPAVSAPPAEAEAQTGFFDEDEDETIALTGDELDNILNTAEITEESAEAAAVEEPEEVTELTEEAPAAQAAEELPAELDLEDLSSVTATPGPVSAPAELDLEGIPEIETEEKGVEPAQEVGDLETLDLEEEATEVEPVSETEGSIELLEEAPPAEKAKKRDTLKKAEEAAGEVDLEALAAEAEELETEEETASPVEDLEVAELEPVAQEAGASGEPQEIEIPFETEPAEERTAGTERLEVEEVPVAAGGEKPGAAAIPEDLKDEIRTVLKYMDHLLEALPDEKIQEFAKSDYFVMYKKLFEDLGLGE